MSHVWQDVGRDEFCCVIIEFLLNCDKRRENFINFIKSFECFVRCNVCEIMK